MRRCLRSGSHHMCMRTLSVTFHFYFCTGPCSKTGPSRFRTWRCLISPGGRPYRANASPVCQSSKEEGYEKPKTSESNGNKLAKAMREGGYGRTCFICCSSSYVTLLKRLLLPFMSRSMWFNIKQAARVENVIIPA
jgi:hypothetical protein